MRWQRRMQSIHCVVKNANHTQFLQGLQNFHTDSIFQGQLPKRLVVGMVDGDAFAGVYNKNPYNFKTMNVNFMQLYSNGEPVQVRPLKPNIADWSLFELL